jgi:hypothetical protein
MPQLLLRGHQPPPGGPAAAAVVVVVVVVVDEPTATCTKKSEPVLLQQQLPTGKIPAEIPRQHTDKWQMLMPIYYTTNYSCIWGYFLSEFIRNSIAELFNHHCAP